MNLFYLSGNTTGGWVTYTSHLIYGLKGIGVPVQLFKVGNRTEQKQRPFGYGVSYRNIAQEDVDNLKGPKVIVALQKNSRDVAAELISQGAWLVVHDPAEFKNFSLDTNGRYITIRKAVADQVPGSHLILHPYKRYWATWSSLETIKRERACSISRIDFDKHTDLILDANRLLEEHLRVNVHGFENRLYTRFKICPKYPEWTQSVSHYPREKSTATEICAAYTFSVDMSIIKGDGGGTQYTFLEAMDARSVNIIHDSWIMPDDEMVPYPRIKANCMTVGSGEELASLLRKPPSSMAIERMVKYGLELLKQHDPEVIAKQFTDVVLRG